MRPMSSTLKVLQTVILAAGSGTRLADSRGDLPKPLMPVAGVPLVRHALDHALAAGCEEAVIVIGYEGKRVRAAVEALNHRLAITFVATADYTLPNGVSLMASEPVAHQYFFLQMVDHLFAQTTLSRLLADPFETGEQGRVLVDRAPTNLDLDDATKVRLAGSRVSAIGKGIEPWDAIDAGCFLLSHGVYDALRRAPASEPRSVSSGMRQLVAAGTLGAADVDGVRWMDVDTHADRLAAEALLATDADRRAEIVSV